MTYTKHSESLRLADWLDDQYDQDHHKADAAAELRHLHAIETALQQGYDAARLEIDHLRGATKMVAPSGECPPSAAYAELPIPSGVSDDGYNLFLLTQMRDFADRTHALRASHGQEPAPTPQADSQPEPVRDYPPLPDFETVEQHIYGACRRYITQDMLEPIHNLIRDAIDADRAAQQGYDAARLEIESLRDEVKEYRHGAGVQKALIETLLADNPEDALDAARYRMLRRGQHLSVINGVGDTLRAEELDAAIDAAHPAVPVAQGDALTDTYVQQVPDKCDRIVWRGRYYHLPIDAAEHSYTEPSPMAKVAAALRQKAEQEDAAYQARRSDQGLMESEWGPMEDAPPHEDPPMHVAVVEGDDTVRTLQWNRDVAAFAYPAGTLLYAARSQAKEGA